MHAQPFRRLVALLVSLAPVSTAAAQCGDWTPGLAAPTAPLRTLEDLESFDDGAGALLFAGGEIPTPAAAVVTSWDGVRWNGELSVLGVPGFALPSFSRLTVAQDAGGPCLVAVAETKPPAPANHVVWKRQGGVWTQLGGLELGRVGGLVSHDAGSGPQLHLVATNTVASVTTTELRRWNGANWVALGASLSGTARALILHDGGAGLELHAAGDQALGGTSPVVRWNGSAWSPVGALATSFGVQALASWDAGAGPELYAATYGEPSSLRHWDGVSWQDHGSFGTGGFTFSWKAVEFRVHDLGSGPELLINPQRWAWNGSAFATWPSSSAAGALDIAIHGGELTSFHGGGTHSSRPITFYDGSATHSLGEGFDASVHSFASFDAGSGRQLHAGGNFRIAGTGRIVQGVGRWNGSQWLACGNFAHLGTVTALASVDFGAGERLYATGDLLPDSGNAAPLVQQWNGTSWSAVGSPSVLGDGFALTVFDPTGSSPRLVVGGDFNGTSGPGLNVAAWNGTSWSALAGLNWTVLALASHDAGSGQELYAGGAFTDRSHLARWNGAGWSTVGSGTNGNVHALASFGGELYAGGTFTLAGAQPVSYLARWNGTSWSDVPGGGANGVVFALSVHDDGRGPALYAGGGFSTIGGITAYDLARFDGANWEAVAGGLDNAVRALASFDDDNDGDAELFAGGDFLHTSSLATGRVARLAGCPHYEAFCFGDGTYLDHTTPCPCGNDGAPGHGCANSFVPAGGLLSATGTTNPDTMVLMGTDQPASSFGIFLQHSALDDRVFHDGVLCGGGLMIRLRGRNAVGGVSTFPNSAFPNDVTLTLSQRGLVVPGSGNTRYYALFYRNASTTFCPPATANGTNGLRVIW